jgi:nucleoid DNA-binding protein
MNKAELIEEVSDKTGLTKKGTGNVVDVMTETSQMLLLERRRLF